jgi:hypothetical protein
MVQEFSKEENKTFDLFCFPKQHGRHLCTGRTRLFNEAVCMHAILLKSASLELAKARRFKSKNGLIIH